MRSYPTIPAPPTGAPPKGENVGTVTSMSSDAERCPFKDGDRIRHKPSGALGTVVIAEDYNGDAHVDMDDFGIGIMSPQEWADHEIVESGGG